MYGIVITYGVVSLLLLSGFEYITIKIKHNNNRLNKLLNCLMLYILIVDKFSIFASIKMYLLFYEDFIFCKVNLLFSFLLHFRSRN